MIKKTVKTRKKDIKTEPAKVTVPSIKQQLPQVNDNYEGNKADLNKLIQGAIDQWKKEFNNNIVRTDSISDLEKLIKLNFLLLDEREKLKTITDKIMCRILDILKSSIDDTELKIKLFEKIKSIDYEEFIS